MGIVEKRFWLYNHRRATLRTIDSVFGITTLTPHPHIIIYIYIYIYIRQIFWSSNVYFSQTVFTKFELEIKRRTWIMHPPKKNWTCAPQRCSIAINLECCCVLIWFYIFVTRFLTGKHPLKWDTEDVWRLGRSCQEKWTTKTNVERNCAISTMMMMMMMMMIDRS